MTRLEKDYYLLPEAEDVSQYCVDDFLSLAEQRHIELWTLAHDWQITWTDEAGSVKVTNPIELFYGGLRTGSKTTKLAEPPIDYFYTGYVRLSSGDMPSLRVNQCVRPTKVYAEKDGRSFVGTIDVLIFDVEIDDILITHEDLSRVENGEVGKWVPRTERAIIATNADGRSKRKPITQALHRSWQEKYIEVKKEDPGKSDPWIAQKISKMPIARGRKMETIRKNMKPKKN